MLAGPRHLEFYERFNASTSLPDTFDQTLIVDDELFPALRAALGVRLAETTWSVRSLAAKGELEANAFGILKAQVRLSHTFLRPENIGSTTLLMRMGLEAYPIRYLGVFGWFGWYERFTLLSGVTYLPNFSAGSVRDRDFVGEFGLGSKITDDITITAKMSTLDEIETYNLNNPYFQAAVGFNPPGEKYELTAFARYRVFLGFGRLHDLTLGFAIRALLDGF